MMDLYATRNRRDGVTVPTIWIAFVISLLVHVAVMWKWLPRIHMPSPEMAERGESMGSLVVQLAPMPRPSATPAPPAAPRAEPPPPPRPQPAPRPPQAAPVIALKTPAPAAAPQPVPAPPPTTPETPPPPRPTAGADFASFVDARRRARGDSPAPPSTGSAPNAPAAEDDKARSERIAAANLATQRKQTFGYDPTQGGGVFQITRMGYNDAEFLFFGWNREIRRNTKQVIEVQKGNNADTRIAVVRRMIAIIREYEREDFLWESHRLGRSLMLSARARDNSGLEDFMMREFFSEERRVPQ
jgi:outer membrane biosynthesis protein TonB